jgi:hypothetical protein
MPDNLPANVPVRPAKEIVLQRNAAPKAALWINDDSGQIVDTLPIESRIRPGSGGCQLCHEELQGNEIRAHVEFDDRHLPRLLIGSGDVCEHCVEWIGLLHYHAENGSVATPRFDDGDLVLRAGTEELYEVLESRLTGIASAGVWFPTYTCQRIEIQEPTGKILPACLGLLFEIADCELQPLPLRYSITTPRQHKVGQRHRSVDLVGHAPDRQQAVTADIRTNPTQMLPEPRRPLLLGRRRGSP